MRLAAGIEYDGSRYGGWQAQMHDPNTLQAWIEEALSRIADHPIKVVCGGRTDTGVHASGQVVHFDTEAVRPAHGWVMGSNAHLPDDIALRWLQPVANDFHARFSALRRVYRYVILNRAYRPALLSRRVCFEYRPLDVALMAKAAGFLLGEHDFSAFRAVGCQARSAVRTLYRLDVSRQGELVILDIEANGFLRHMVRNIAGVLLAIGVGAQAVTWAREVLESRDRKMAGVTAEPWGLYLCRIDYPEKFAIPQCQRQIEISACL
ncbi:MAG: tRNA pseudouridine(38-40) synthase TruA [Thiohalomonadaceae bacterium]